MVVISRIGSSHCMGTGIVRCRAGKSAIFSRRHKFHGSNVNKSCVGFSSLSCDSAGKTQISKKGYFAVVGCKRAHKVIAAASPPTEDPVVDTEPLKKDDLVEYLASGCKPKEKWRYDILLLHSNLFPCVKYHSTYGSLF